MAGTIPGLLAVLAQHARWWDRTRLGRFDGVDRQIDTLTGSGFDSRTLQPQRRPPGVAECVADVLRSG
jgi:hypothetical protein